MDHNDHALLDNVVERILSKVTATSDYEIELQIHDLIIKNVSYVNEKNRSEHTIEGPLLNKKAVCEGIAKAVKYLLNKKSIQSEIVIGKLSEERETLHAWNVVLIDEKWYHLDVTSDMALSEANCYRYDYFNLSDDEIEKDHIIIESPVRCITSKMDYYYRSGLVMNTQSDYVNYLSKCIRHKQTIMTFKLPSTNDPDLVIDKIMENTKYALKEHKRFYNVVIRVRPNTSQLVFTVQLS